jgi:hypothetical protein
VAIFSRRFLQVGILAYMTGLLALPSRAASFSDSSLKGSYSFLTNLWTADVNTNEFGMVGVMRFDGEGKVTGSYTSVSAGVVETGTLGGTYSVNSNGTGSLDFTTGSTSQFAIILNRVDDKVAHGVELLQTNDSNNEALSGSAVLQSTTAETYSVASLKGNLTYDFNHWTANPSQFEGAAIGIFTFDGKGNVEGSETEMYGGTIQTGSFIGTYTVNSEGYGAIAVGSAAPIYFALNRVAGARARGFQFLDTNTSDGNGNLVLAGSALVQ